MAITFDAECSSAGDRTEYLYRLQEKLLLEHNANGKDFRDGKITETQWRAYLADTYEPRSKRIEDEILIERKRMKGRDETYTPKWDPELTKADD